MVSVVLDTNVFVSALIRAETAPRQVLRHCLDGDLVPLMGNALFAEYGGVLRRNRLFEAGPLNGAQRQQLFEAFLSVCRWVPVYYLWRPNLRDEADNHLIELALAGNADWLITGNARDVTSGELQFPQLRVVTPSEFVDEWRRSWER